MQESLDSESFTLTPGEQTIMIYSEMPLENEISGAGLMNGPDLILSPMRKHGGLAGIYDPEPPPISSRWSYFGSGGLIGFTNVIMPLKVLSIQGQNNQYQIQAGSNHGFSHFLCESEESGQIDSRRSRILKDKCSSMKGHCRSFVNGEPWTYERQAGAGYVRLEGEPCL